MDFIQRLSERLASTHPAVVPFTTKPVRKINRKWGLCLQNIQSQIDLSIESIFIAREVESGVLKGRIERLCY